jgi:aspartate/methionine/tyrosine aminotransferase
MFSARTGWQRQPNRLSLLLRAKRERGERILDLTLSNPTESGIPYPVAEVLAALQRPEALRYLPHPRGIPEARSAVAGYYQANGIPVDPSSLFLTAGTSEAYALLFALLCDPGDTVLVPSPCYPLFEFIARVAAVGVKSYPLRYDGEWHVDLDTVRSLLGHGVRALVAIHPHNPTGMFLKREELAGLQEALAGRGAALIVDEVFIDYPLEPSPASALSTAGPSPHLTFTLNGLSKMAGLPHMKIAWVAVSGPAPEREEALERLEFLGDTFLTVNTMVQAALPGLLRAGETVREGIRRRIRGNLALLDDLLTGHMLCSRLRAEGGWYAVVRVPGTRTDEEWAVAMLEESGVLVYPGYFFDFAVGGHLVLSLLPEPAVFRAGVEAMLRNVT